MGLPCLIEFSSLRERRTVSYLSPAAFFYSRDYPPLLAFWFSFLLALSAASGVEAGQEIQPNYEVHQQADVYVDEFLLVQPLYCPLLINNKRD